MDEETAKDNPPEGETATPETEPYLAGDEPPKVVISPAEAETYLEGGEPPLVISPNDQEIYLSGGEPGVAPPPRKAGDPDPAAQPPPPPPRSKWRWIVPILFALLAIFLLMHFCGADKSGSAAKTGAAGASGRGAQGAAITVGQSKTGNMNIYVDALGTVIPLATVTLYSQITGRVMDVYYHEGQIVQKGDPLVDIDPRPYEANLMQAEEPSSATRAC